MPEHSHPGVFVEEVSSGPTPIEGVPTSIAGFVGGAERGPTDPRRLTSWAEFRRVYGDPIAESYLAYAVEGFFANGGEVCHVARIDGIEDGLELCDYIGDRRLPVDQRTGLAALESIDEISILNVPDEVRLTPTDLTALTQQAIEQCERRKDRFCVASSLQGQSDVATLRPRWQSSHAALYYPWITIRDPVTGAEVSVPPGGHVAGVYARTDRTRGVHKAPANEVVRGARDLEFQVTQPMQDVLNPLGVNTLRDFSGEGRGILVWGARTLSSDPEWRYVSVRRLFLFLEESIDKGTQWVVFEPNDQPLWAKVLQIVGDFLTTLWRNGALQGTTPDEAFFVRCDHTTMTQDDIDNGRLICLIGFAPVKPAEFTIFRIQQRTVEAQ